MNTPNLIARFFTPNLTGLILFTLLLTLDLLFYQGSTTVISHAAPTVTSHHQGFPTLFTLTSSPPAATSLTLHWLNLTWLLAALWCLTMPLGRFLSLRPAIQGSATSLKRPRPARTLLIVIAATLLLACIPAALGSKYMWGYYFFRPGIDSRITSAREILSITPVITANFPANPELSRLPRKNMEWFQDLSLSDILARSKNDPYYLLEDRALAAFPPSLNATASKPLPEENLRGLYALAISSGMLLEGDPGYPDAKDLHGLVYELKGPSNEPLLLLSLRGRELSNDHYPFYELLFTRSAATDPWHLLSATRFFYDAAGMEGAEFPGLLLLFSILGLLLSLPITLLILTLRILRTYRRARPAHEVLLPSSH